ncbi:glycosyltransferase 87 family protein [Chloroflexota bacterium]
MKTYSVRVYLFLVSIVGSCSAFFHTWQRLFSIDIAYNDILTKTLLAIQPGMPYIDKLIEYPVLTGLFIRLMGFAGGGEWGYYALSAVFLTVFAVVATYFLNRIGDGAARRRLLAYWIFAPSMFFFLIYNWDIMPVLFAVVAFYFVMHGRQYPASLFLALGFCCKFYPAMYLLPLLLRDRSIGNWGGIIGVFALTTLAVNAFFMVSNFDGWYYFFDLSNDRLPNPDSIWGVVHYYAPQLGVSQINALSLSLFTAGIAILVWKHGREPTIKLCFALTLLFLLTNKVFSPQFTLWLLPFFVLSPPPGVTKRLFYALEVSNLMVMFTLLTYWFTTERDVTYLHVSQFFVVIRHAVMAYLLIKLLTTREGQVRVGEAKPDLGNAIRRRPPPVSL